MSCQTVRLLFIRYNSQYIRAKQCFKVLTRICYPVISLPGALIFQTLSSSNICVVCNVASHKSQDHTQEIYSYSYTSTYVASIQFLTQKNPNCLLKGVDTCSAQKLLPFHLSREMGIKVSWLLLQSQFSCRQALLQVY